VYSLAINSLDKSGKLNFTNEEIESTIALVNHNSRRTFGFTQQDGRNDLSMIAQNKI
jgi:hypothetical protein